MPEGEPTNGYCSSSSGEEDGDAAWRAAIDSIAQTTTYVSSTTKHTHPNHDDDDDYDGHKPKTRQLKHYQLKAQNLLNEILENSIEIVRKPVPVVDEDPESNECGIRLFKHAQPGIVFDHVDEPQPPRKRPRILPGGDIDEKSKKQFRKQIRSVAVNGIEIIAAANDAYKKSLARLEAKDAAAKAKAKREDERVENLKKIRGEKWLPSMAQEMQVKIRH
ncbi:hypothetical protein GLYMA_05G105500v4 [Glycine max]|uniref:Uncharacterized protein n=1 Tax=Glycine max TaxID=3847 RepID=I1K2D8_SOYBN|nr:uncharacterized protein LOC100777991 isoform X1 [Glycine max]KAG5057567.1 hypothetical protein JHK86_012563 [Glycine max]KAH1133757.1 hypothetical protein GYH30_012247 [Glycine max]KRH58105.1 hypothetical protein GLYMA_05G105500v4 [Glycine max]|eukprot:XP_006579948.1 uncharacterized protein LOC100777991 isoform X1 [Glycine max]